MEKLISNMTSGCKNCQSLFIKQYTKHVFCSLKCSNRYNLNNKNFSIILPQDYSIDLAEFVGILLGDGNISPYQIKIYLNLTEDKDYVSYIKSLSGKLFSGATTSIVERKNKGTATITLSGKDITEFLKKIGLKSAKNRIPPWILKNQEFFKATIRGLIDTEGSIGFKYFSGRSGKYLYKQLTFTNKNPVLLQFVEKHLKLLGYKPTLNSSKNIYLSNRMDIERYLIEIGSGNPKIAEKILTTELKGYHWQAVSMLTTV